MVVSTGSHARPPAGHQAPRPSRRARAQQGDVGAQAEITALVADLPSSQGCAPEVVETEPEPTMPIPLENPGNPNQG